jgi:SAM-dependent methyltransferase
MNPELVGELVCPGCASRLSLESAERDPTGEISRGALHCAECTARFPVIGGIPRFVPAENYCDSFGLEWNLYSRTQMDKFNGRHASRDRLLRESQWTLEELSGQRILECGSGAGRFTDVLLRAGAKVFTFDFSSAVEANDANNGPHPNLFLVQADIYAIPFRKASFDKVLCFGVLQHTPDVRRAFLSMVPYLRPGGKIVVDVYPKHWRYLCHWKYLLRPFTRRMDRRRLHRIVERAVPWLLPVSLALGRAPLIGKQLVRLVPVSNPEMVLPGLSAATLRQWATLDTFDWLSPAYDRPQTLRTLRAWFQEAGLEGAGFDHMAVYVGRGRMPGGDASEAR